VRCRCCSMRRRRLLCLPGMMGTDACLPSTCRALSWLANTSLPSDCETGRPAGGTCATANVWRVHESEHMSVWY
jgi:hypothetical protein